MAGRSSLSVSIPESISFSRRPDNYESDDSNSRKNVTAMLGSGEWTNFGIAMPKIPYRFDSLSLSRSQSLLEAEDKLLLNHV